MRGRVVDIYIAEEGGGSMRQVEAVRAEAGVGLEGDRYASGRGEFSHKVGPKRQVTLIEAEAVEAARRDYRLDVDAIDTRRNIVVRGMALNHLVDKEFEIGKARLRGVTLCEPCNHMDEVAGKTLSPAFVHRGGLNAEVITSGEITVGDAIELASA